MTFAQRYWAVYAALIALTFLLAFVFCMVFQHISAQQAAVIAAYLTGAILVMGFVSRLLSGKPLLGINK